jgi:hypothetical protein
MFMTSFHSSFPDIALAETQRVTITHAPGLPDGEYAFFESYCDDPACDCRRVLLNVYRSDNLSTCLAVISYGWESVGFYRRWLHGSVQAQDAKGPMLEPLQPQSSHARALLALFRTLVEDDTYIQRLKRHYALMKGHIKPPVHTPTAKVKRGRPKPSS